MSKSKHTQGPWRVTRAGAKVKAGAITEVAYMSRHLKSEEERKANADLIAAAPELAAALEDAMRWIGRLIDWEGADDPDIDTWRSALAKARGES